MRMQVPAAAKPGRTASLTARGNSSAVSSGELLPLDIHVRATLFRPACAQQATPSPSPVSATQSVERCCSAKDCMLAYHRVAAEFALHGPCAACRCLLFPCMPECVRANCRRGRSGAGPPSGGHPSRPSRCRPRRSGRTRRRRRVKSQRTRTESLKAIDAEAA